jgi:hypothetical protein
MRIPYVEPHEKWFFITAFPFQPVGNLRRNFIGGFLSVSSGVVDFHEAGVPMPGAVPLGEGGERHSMVALIFELRGPVEICPVI